MNPIQLPHRIMEAEFFDLFKKALACPHEKLFHDGYEPTPVISFWPMRPKWEKYAPAWEYVMLAESRLLGNKRIQSPPIHLAYLRSGERVIQVALWSDLKLTHD
jgi:hypothetical protein